MGEQVFLLCSHEHPVYFKLGGNNVLPGKWAWWGKKKNKQNIYWCARFLNGVYQHTRKGLSSIKGDFKLMRCCRSKQLIDIIMSPGGYTADNFKNRSSLNKAVAYIVPLQADLPLNGDVQKVKVVNYLFVSFFPMFFMLFIPISVNYILGWRYWGVKTKMQQVQPWSATVYFREPSKTLQHQVSACKGFLYV